MTDWVTVPREPTQEMLAEAARHDWYAQKDPTWADLYRAMLSAAPPAPLTALERDLLEALMEFADQKFWQAHDKARAAIARATEKAVGSWAEERLTEKEQQK